MKRESKEWFFRVWPWDWHLAGFVTFGNRGWGVHLLNWRPSHWFKVGPDHIKYDGHWNSWWFGIFGLFCTTPDWDIDWKAVRERERRES